MIETTPLNYTAIDRKIRASPPSDRNFWVYADRFGFNYKQLNGKTILDLGSSDSTFAKQSFGLTERVVRLDPTYSNKPPEYKNDAVTGIAQDLPFRDNSFDETIASGSIYWIKTGLNESLLEMIRVTKLGGRICIHPTELKKGAEDVRFSSNVCLLNVSKNKQEYPTLFITKVPFNTPDDWRNEVESITELINFSPNFDSKSFLTR